MTRTEANAVARDMERCGYTITAMRNQGGYSWAVDATHPRTGTAVTIHDSAQWIALEPDMTPTPAAGRPPVYGETMRAHTVRLTAAQWEHVRQQGGDYSNGLRAIVQRDIEGGR